MFCTIDPFKSVFMSMKLALMQYSLFIPLPCEAVGIGLITGNGCTSRFSHAPANRLARWFDRYLVQNKY